MWFNLQLCNLLSNPPSPLPTPGSVWLMKDFFVVHSEDDKKSKIYHKKGYTSRHNPVQGFGPDLAGSYCTGRNNEVLLPCD